jgi:hypothetical protein
LGVNYLLGDIFESKRWVRPYFWKNFYFKGLLKFSKHPRDSMGIGFGYRFPTFTTPVLELLNSLSIYTAWLWTEETEDAGAKGSRKRQWVFGLSFNLDAAGGWLK